MPTPPSECPQCVKIASRTLPILWEDSHFIAVHKTLKSCGVVGHLQLLSKRHFQGPATMTDAEAAAIGPALKRCCAALERVTRCDRVYTAALGSVKSGSHFHAHLIPLYVAGGHPDAAGTPPTSVTGTPFDLFLQEKLAVDGVAGAVADEAQCKAVAAKFKEEMAAGAEEEQEDR